MRALRARAHAKLNLALAVTGQRADGYHRLRSVFVRLALHDDLEVVVRGASDRLEIRGDVTVPVEGNLVSRAVMMVRTAVAPDLPALDIRLHKRIPAAAGLAGGSSDAAAALALALESAGMTVDPRRRLALALELGADVPFFEADLDAALVGGIGEGIEPLPAPDPAPGIVLVTPREGLSTASVFGAWDRGARPAEPGAAPTVARLAAAMAVGSQGEPLHELLAATGPTNDLWLAATSLAPALARSKDELEAASAMRFHMTGSGSTLFTLTPDLATASEVTAGFATDLPALDERATVTVTTITQTGTGGTA